MRTVFANDGAAAPAINAAAIRTLFMGTPFPREIARPGGVDAGVFGEKKFFAVSAPGEAERAHTPLRLPLSTDLRNAGVVRSGSAPWTSKEGEHGDCRTARCVARGACQTHDPRAQHPVGPRSDAPAARDERWVHHAGATGPRRTGHR